MNAWFIFLGTGDFTNRQCKLYDQGLPGAPKEEGYEQMSKYGLEISTELKLGSLEDQQSLVPTNLSLKSFLALKMQENCTGY